MDRRVVDEIIVNHDHRFLYCPIPKAGSTTLKILLHELEGVSVEEVAGPDRSRLGALHDGSRNRLHYLGAYDDADVLRMLNEWFTFAFVRNPWTRLLSAFRNKIEPHPANLQRPRYQQNPDRVWVGRLIDDVKATRPGDDRDVSFAEFARYVSRQDPAEMNQHYRPQVVLGGFGFIPYDFVGRLERFEDDYAHVAARVGIDRPLPSNRRPFSGVTDRVAEYYDAETADLVGEIYAGDVARFGYTFPG